MPELPEVEITKRSLSKQILYKKVRSVTIINPKLRYNLNREKLNILEGKIVKKIKRRSKYILLYFNDNNILTNLFGINDKNIQTLEKINNVKIQYRGNKVKIVGSKKSINETREELVSLFKEAKKGIEIDEDKIKETKSMITLENDSNEQMDLFFQTKKRKIIPRSKNQKLYFDLLNKKDIVFAVGPAGTGKTFLAVAKAVTSLQEGKVKKIILSRPAVEAGEKLGFLPGDLKEKVDPFLRPI